MAEIVIGVMNNTSSTVLNFINVVYSMRSCTKSQALCLYIFLTLYVRTLSQNPSFISTSFYHYISVHCPKTQALSLQVFTIIFLYIVPKPKLYLYKFLPLYFCTLSQNPSFISISFLPLYFRTWSQNPSKAEAS